MDPKQRPEQKDNQIRAARQWAIDFRPPAGKCYGATSEYALWLYRLVESHWNALDKKADDVVRYAALVVTVIGTLSAMSGGRISDLPLEKVHWTWVAISFLVALAALVCAVAARRPTLLPIPGPARSLLDFVAGPYDSDELQTKAIIAASLHAATVELRLLTEKKGRAITCALWLLVGSLSLLFLPLFLVAVGR